MPTFEVIAVADQVRRHLQDGAYAALGTVDLPPDDRPLGALSAALVVLADVDHRAEEEAGGRPVAAAVWAELALQLRFLEDVAVFRATRVGRCEWDVHRNRMRWSAEHHRIFGLDASAFGGTVQAFLGCLLPGDVERVRGVLAGALQGGGAFDYEARLVRPSGAVRGFRCRGRVSHGPDGRPARVVGAVVETTDPTEV